MSKNGNEITNTNKERSELPRLEELKEIAEMVFRTSREWKRLELHANVDNKGEIVTDLKVIFSIDEDKTLTVKDVSEYLKVPEKSVLDLMKTGKLRSFKVGRAVRIMKSDLDKFIEDQKREQESITNTIEIPAPRAGCLFWGPPSLHDVRH